MKKITGLVIILAVLILGGYYGMGAITERTIKNNLAVVNQSNGLYVEVLSYKRGWFESQVQLNWNLHVPARLVKSASGQVESVPAQDYRVGMPLTIYHGPVIFADHNIQFGLGFAHANLDLPANLLEQFNTYFTKDSTEPKMEISLYVDYLNNSQIKMEVPQFNVIAKQGKMTFDWLGMSSSVKTTSSLNEVKGDFAFDGASFSQDKIVSTLSKIAGSYNLQKTDTGLFLGAASTTVPSIVVTNNNEKMFELDEFAVDSNTDIQKDLFNANFKTSMAKLFINGRTYGPGQLEMSIKNLDAIVLANINAQINKAQQSPELEKQQAMLAILPELPKLFAQGAAFDISTNVVVPEGKAEGMLTVALPAGSSANPFELIQKIEGNGQLKLPALLVKEIVTQSLKQKIMSQAATAGTAENSTVVAQASPHETTAGATTTASATTATAATTATGTTAVVESNKSTEGSTTVKAASPAEKVAVSTDGAVAGGVKSEVATNITTNATTSNTLLSFEEINKQALAQTDHDINNMVQSGLLVQQGTDYIIAVKLSQGQLIVNGKPFNAGMLKF